MKPEDAIEAIKSNYPDERYSLLREGLAMAIIALEKQAPKKPNKFDGYQCSECGGKLARQTDLVYQKYCHHCGQCLKWN